MGVSDLETWARRVLEEAVVSEREFSNELPRIGALARRYGLDELREVIVKMTSAGLAFKQVLEFCERLPLNLVEAQRDVLLAQQGETYASARE